MKRAEATAKRKILDLDRGLFLVRYGDAEDAEKPPIVRVSLDREIGSDNFVILHPDAHEAILSGPGSALAIRAATPAKLLVEVIPLEANGSTTATVKVEALTPGEVSAPLVPRGESFAPGALDLDGIRIQGHIAGRGDVVVNRDQWLGGPSAPSRVEGIRLDWPTKPTGLDLHYAVKFARPQGSTSQMTAMGQFAGTRGRALPVTGVVMELSGEDADAYALSVEALFLGSPAVRSRGQRINLGGPTGREPLVGLRIDLSPSSAVAPASMAVGAKAKSTPQGKVRVFKGRQKASQATA